jgi:hypothetical protein
MGGLGQVGSAIVSLLEDKRRRVYILDSAEEMEAPKNVAYDFLHVCIPYGDDFVRQVKRQVLSYNPRFVVVHSTVPVGTTRSIGSYAAHSPVRGQHPNLKDGILKFTKYVGAHNEKTRSAVVTHLRELGIQAEAWSKAEDTELMKGLCLSRYLNDLAFYETAFKACKKFGVAPIRLVQWTNTYNDGYYGTKHQRPELTFPMGKVGGHCVMPVSKMLAGQTGYKFFRKNLDVFDENR